MSESIETNGATRKRLVKYNWNADERILTQFVNAEPMQSFQIAELSTDIMDMLAIHGLRQKLADAHAGKIPEAVELSKDVWDGLVAGNWTSRGEGGERAGLFVEAYAAIKQRPIDEIRNIVNAIEAGDDDDKKALLAKARANKDVVAKMRTLAAERAAARAEAANRAATGEEAVDL